MKQTAHTSGRPFPSEGPAAKYGQSWFANELKLLIKALRPLRGTASRTICSMISGGIL